MGDHHPYLHTVYPTSTEGKFRPVLGGASLHDEIHYMNRICFGSIYSGNYMPTDFTQHFPMKKSTYGV